MQTHIELKKARGKINQYARELEQKNQELKELLQRVEQLAMNDYLTGVYNRRSAVELIQKELARSQREGKSFSILMADIDDFKQVNDRYGHECGDYVLKRVAGLIREASRQYDVVARWGGEEFLLMLPRTQLEEAKIVAERIRALVARQVFSYQGFSFSVTLTIGVAGFLPGDDVDGLIRRADKFMYLGKKREKNQVVVEERK
ncbi:MAG: GGDEF domain-containing protein [Syntrophomonadaceae bacterium]|nr:GGDEF domain-containing protein [Syntrophomonadaceae bacterium]